jgi:hypothetical protein
MLGIIHLTAFFGVGGIRDPEVKNLFVDGAVPYAVSTLVVVGLFIFLPTTKCTRVVNPQVVAITLLAFVFAIAIVPTLSSAWMCVLGAYYVIIGLLAAGFTIDVVRNFFAHGVWDLKTIPIDACVFGFLLYFVTVRAVTRKSDICC